MGVLGLFAFTIGLGLRPFGRNTIAIAILSWAAIVIPLHIFAVARSMRSSKRKAAVAWAQREQQDSLRGRNDEGADDSRV